MAAGSQKIRLTDSQVRLLMAVAATSRFVVPYYSPAKALKKHGLCEWGVVHKYPDFLSATQAGRDWIAENQDRIREVEQENSKQES